MIITELQNVDLDQLDMIEKQDYDNFSRNMSKEEALQIIINNVEGDYSQLSEELSILAAKHNQRIEIGKDQKKIDDDTISKLFAEAKKDKALIKKLKDKVKVLSWACKSKDKDKSRQATEIVLQRKTIQKLTKTK
jgi:DNA polymerase III delta prime subunit